MKIESLHFSSHKQHANNAGWAAVSFSSIWHVSPPAIPQNLHEQYVQFQTPEGNFCHKEKKNINDMKAFTETQTHFYVIAKSWSHFINKMLRITPDSRREHLLQDENNLLITRQHLYRTKLNSTSDSRKRLSQTFHK
jgi:hypothetical protein